MDKNNFKKPIRGSTKKPDHIMLSFSDDPHTTATVTWRTSADAPDGYIEYELNGEKKTAPALVTIMETDIDIHKIHWATARGLKPGTKYTYTVGCEKERSEVFSFETEPENLNEFKFIIISDHQNGTPFSAPEYAPVRKMLLHAIEKHPDIRFILTAGDNTDNGQNDLQWNGHFHGLQGIIESIPYIMGTGNHDNRGFLVLEEPVPTGKFYLEHADYFDERFAHSYPLNGAENYKTETFSFDYGNVHFLMMGINGPEEVDAWAYKDLQNSDKTWKIGAYHFPIFPAIPEGITDEWYPALQKSVEEGRLDILVSGHEHSFARTFPIKDFNIYDKPSQGTVHYIMGNAGQNIHCSNSQKVWHNRFYPQEEFVSMYSLVEVKGDKITLTAYLDDGRIADRLIIDKSSDTIDPPATAPVYHRTKMAFKGQMLELIARDLEPQKKDGQWYAPFAAVAQFVGGEVIKEKGTVSIDVYGKKAKFTQGSKTVVTSNGDVEMSEAPYIWASQLYIPVEDSAKIFGMYCVYSKRNNFISWEHTSEEKPISKQPE